MLDKEQSLSLKYVAYSNTIFYHRLNTAVDGPEPFWLILQTAPTMTPRPPNFILVAGMASGAIKKLARSVHVRKVD